MLKKKIYYCNIIFTFTIKTWGETKLIFRGTGEMTKKSHGDGPNKNEIAMVIQACYHDPLSWSYKLAYLGEPLIGAECWYVIIVRIMYDISLVNHVFQTTVKTARRQKHQLLAHIGFFQEKFEKRYIECKQLFIA